MNPTPMAASSPPRLKPASAWAIAPTIAAISRRMRNPTRDIVASFGVLSLDQVVFRYVQAHFVAADARHVLAQRKAVAVQRAGVDAHVAVILQAAAHRLGQGVVGV